MPVIYVVTTESYYFKRFDVIGAYPTLEQAEERILRDDGHDMNIYACEPDEAEWVNNRFNFYLEAESP